MRYVAERDKIPAPAHLSSSERFGMSYQPCLQKTVESTLVDGVSVSRESTHDHLHPSSGAISLQVLKQRWVSHTSYSTVHTKHFNSTGHV